MIKSILLILVLSVTASAQSDLTDIGKIGIATPSPVAIVDVDGLPAPGAAQVFRLRTNEMGSGDYGISYFSYPGNNGETRRNNQMCLGYNIGGPGFVSGETEWHQCFESRYKTSEGRLQSEYYITAGLGSVSSRPFSIDFYHDNASTQVGINTASFIVANPSQSNVWLRFTSSDTNGELNLFNNSGLNYWGNREWFVKAIGQGVIGRSGTTWKLFGGGITGETLSIFGNSSTGGGKPLTISVGSNGAGFRIGGNGNRWQATGNYSGYSDIQTAFDVSTTNIANKIVKRGASGEIDIGSVKVNGAKVVGTQCPAIPNSTGRADNTRAINALLACLRQHGLIAP